MQSYFGVYMFWCLEFIQELGFNCGLESHKYINTYFYFRNVRNYKLLLIYLGIVVLDSFHPQIILGGSLDFGDSLIMKNKRIRTLGKTRGYLPFFLCCEERECQLELVRVPCGPHVMALAQAVPDVSISHLSFRLSA